MLKYKIEKKKKREIGFGLSWVAQRPTLSPTRIYIGLAESTQTQTWFPLTQAQLSWAGLLAPP